MKKYLWPILLSIFLSLQGPALSGAKEIVINSDDQFRFAKTVMDKGDYQRAIGEFERLIYFFPDDEKVPAARTLIGLCYLEGKEYVAARKSLEQVIASYPGTPEAGKALFLIGESYHRQGMAREAEHYFMRVIQEVPDSGWKDKAVYRLGWSRAEAGRWEEASETFGRIGEASPLYAPSLNLSEKVLEGEELPLKSPTAAGIMAGILPGAGHVYCNRYRDGVVAFLLNGLFIWAAAESFEKDQDVLGGVLSFLEAGWYAGNIYSAVNSAHKHNRKVRNDFIRSLPDNLSLDLFSGTSGDRKIGLALSFDF